jgi:transporter family-2 protein
MVVAGALLAGQARVNGGLADRLGEDTSAAVLTALVSFAVGTVAVVTALLASPRARRGVRRWRRADVKWWYCIGGLGGASLVGASAAAVPVIGVALLSVCVVAGQTAGSLAVDEVGLAPGGRRPISLFRIVGSLLAVGALFLGAAGEIGGRAEPALFAAVAAAGFLVAGQQAVNGRLRLATGDARVAAAVSFVGGTVALAVVTGVLALNGRYADGLPWPDDPVLYLGGLGGAVYIVLGAATVTRLGVLRLSLASVAGQLLGSVLLDVVVPAPGEELHLSTVAAVVLTLVAVAVAGIPRGLAR